MRVRNESTLLGKLFVVSVILRARSLRIDVREFFHLRVLSWNWLNISLTRFLTINLTQIRKIFCEKGYWIANQVLFHIQSYINLTSDSASIWHVKIKNSYCSLLINKYIRNNILDPMYHCIIQLFCYVTEINYI